MIVVRIETIRWTTEVDTREALLTKAVQEVLDERVVVADNIGAALNFIAPDPADGAVFRVTIISRKAIWAGVHDSNN